MPRIPDQLQHAIAFLYPSRESALKAMAAGGTGFFVNYKANVYLVTNAHVALDGARTIRVNAENGGFQIIETNPSDWRSHPDGDDIAICRLDLKKDWIVSPLEWNDLAVTPERMTELNMGVGDEVIMIGRFIAHDGMEVNQPLARFGNIGMMPGQPIKDWRGLLVEAFLVEMRSLSGFSGSPVFVYMGPGTYRGNKTMMPFYSETIGLMGIDTGHKTMTQNIFNKKEKKSEDLIVNINTGVAIVSPVWKIERVLDTW